MSLKKERETCAKNARQHHKRCVAGSVSFAKECPKVLVSHLDSPRAILLLHVPPNNLARERLEYQ